MDSSDSIFGRDEAMRANEEVYGSTKEHQGSFTHEAIAGAAGFEAMKALENRLRESGEKVTHPLMKEMLLGLAAGEVDKLIETKGLDKIDAIKAKRMAGQVAHKIADEKYPATRTTGSAEC